MSTIDKALKIAIEAHFEEKDRYGAPFILHPLRMMMRVEGDEEKIVCALHDVVEKTSTSLADLKREGFSKEILEAVDCLTKRENESYEDYIERVAPNEIARTVKLVDLEDNMDLTRAEKLNDAESKKMQQRLRAWHRLRKEF